MTLPSGLTLRNMSDTVILPKATPQEGSISGIKVSRNIWGYDFSLSYVYGRDFLPLAKKATFIPTDTLGGVNIASELIYPRLHIAGLDIAGAIGDVGIWGEAAVFYPEKIEMVTDLSALGMGTQTSIALDDKPFVRYVIGTDYTFKNDFYFNLQYVHGFFHERGNNNLENYLMTAVEWRSSDEKLKITPLGIGAEIKDFKDIENNYALILSSEIAYYPVDNAEVTLGARLVDGKDTTTFGKLKDSDELYFKIKYSF